MLLAKEDATKSNVQWSGSFRRTNAPARVGASDGTGVALVNTKCLERSHAERAKPTGRSDVPSGTGCCTSASGIMGATAARKTTTGALKAAATGEERMDDLALAACRCDLPISHCSTLARVAHVPGFQHRGMNPAERKRREKHGRWNYAGQQSTHHQKGIQSELRPILYLCKQLWHSNLRTPI